MCDFNAQSDATLLFAYIHKHRYALVRFIYGIHIFSSLKISNKNILKNILEI